MTIKYATMLSTASGEALIAWNGCNPASQFDGKHLPEGIPGYRTGLVIGFRLRRQAEAFRQWASVAFVQLAREGKLPAEATGEVFMESMS